jgi:hypothetical protein
METSTLSEFPKVAEVLERYGAEFIELYKSNLVASGRPASGRLADSLSYKVDMGANVYAVDISLLDYWKYIESGTRPHWPPVSAIREWIKVKPVIPRPMANGKLPTESQLVFLIGRKISRVGTEGINDFERANQEIFSRMEMSIAEAVTEDLQRQVSIIFKDFEKR